MINAARFWAKVKIGKSNECWPYQAGRDKNGYGVVCDGKRKIGAHRVAFILTKGKPKKGIEVTHDCDNPPCCNPAHLIGRTKAGNHLDCVAKNRHAKGVVHGRSKLTPQKVRTIRKSKKSNRVLAKYYGVAYSTIQFIKRKLTWRSVK